MNHTAPYPPEDAALRTQRQMRLCAELAELAMQLARIAAARVVAESTDPDPAAEPSEPASKPSAARKPVDQVVLFTRLAATVRACITLESRLANGDTLPRAPQSRTSSRAGSLAPPSLRDDPRRPQLREAISYLVKGLPDGVGLMREAERRIDDELTKDAYQTITMSDLFYSLCDEIGIGIDFAKLPDSSLNLLSDPPNPNATPPAD